MKIIGHRGAAGLAPGNTASSIKAAIKAGVYMVEIDVRLTADGYVVLMHKAIFEKKKLPELEKLKAEHDQLITLHEALEVLGDYPVVIDIKDDEMTEQITEVVRQHPKSKVNFASFSHEDLRKLHNNFPKAKICALSHFPKTFGLAKQAREIGATMIGVNKWYFNPLSHGKHKTAGLELYIYNVNSRIMAKALQYFYPDVAICTDYPNRFKNKRG